MVLAASHLRGCGAMEELVEELMDIVGTCRDELVLVKYNKGMLEFLFQQMEKVESQRLRLSEARELPEWWNAMKRILQSGAELVRRHQVVDFLNLNRIAETRAKVERKCQDLKILLAKLPMGRIFNIQTSVTEVIVADDRTRLRWLVACLADSNDSNNACHDKATAKELQKLRKDHSISDRAHLIREEDLEWWDEPIGKGLYGAVWEARWQEHRVAVKKYHQQFGYLSDEAKAEFFAEVEIHIRMKHPNVLATLAASATEECVFTVVELAKTNLKKLYQQEKLSVSQRIGLLTEAAYGLMYLHDRGLVHRDVKSENFLLFGEFPDNFVLKVSDFGLATMKPKTMMTLQQPETLLCGAPDISRGEPPSRKSDVFNFGIVMHEVMAQQAPYQRNASQHNLTSKKRKGASPCTIPEDCPPALIKLMRGCVTLNASKRPLLVEVLNCLTELRHEFNMHPVPPDVTEWIEQTKNDLHHHNPEHMALLHVAAQEGNCGVGSVLISPLGNDVDAKDMNAWTPLHWAAYNGHVDMVALLMKHEADKDAKNRGGHTPLHLASSTGRKGVVQLLLEEGADRDAKTQFEETALHWAAHNGHKHVVAQLIDMGADRNAKGESGSTPLHCAIEKGHIDVAQVLVERGAELDVVDQYQRTPLHISAALGDVDVVHLLVTYGANKEARSLGGDTPLHWAARHNHGKVAAFLLQHGATMEARNDCRLTPQDVARKEVKRLLKTGFKTKVVRALKHLLN
ncbi:unnamed protein product [Ostreobium quekettii]|uniref:Protein kinase domain-containing protein n=1 Tax=Ostreobium quekettii TaxID=121088 RepID=A0A8S1JGK6_9CHLO|nr:unnamed protein product [Ostreobium quekettii]|eukprot:evm.model.scf_54.5 EVM.evm.TU.scf_54.5   scf_54:90490-96369(-)